MDLTDRPTRPRRANQPGRAGGAAPAGLTDRGRRIVDTTTRLGTTTRGTLQALHAPEIQADTFRTRLQALQRSGHLRQTRFIGPTSAVWLYTPGPAALVPGEPRPWQPPLAQLGHTLAIGDTLVALLRPDLIPGVTVHEWHGEAELRSWEQAGHPRPDLRAHWRTTRPAPSDQAPPPPGPASGWLEIEVDRGTESRGAWRRKLARYLTFQPSARILVTTTSDIRARNIATLARAAGLALLALDQAALTHSNPLTYDASTGRRTSLGHVLTGAP